MHVCNGIDSSEAYADIGKDLKSGQRAPAIPTDGDWCGFLVGLDDPSVFVQHQPNSSMAASHGVAEFRR